MVFLITAGPALPPAANPPPKPPTLLLIVESIIEAEAPSKISTPPPKFEAGPVSRAELDVMLEFSMTICVLVPLAKTAAEAPAAFPVILLFVMVTDEPSNASIEPP